MTTRIRPPLVWIERNVPRSDLWPEAILFLFWVGMLVVARLLTPSPAGHGTHTQLGLPPCGVFAATGRPCPTCGMTTSFAHIMHGNLADAFAAHPLGPVVFLYLGLGAVYFFTKYLFRYRPVMPRPLLLWPNVVFVAGVMGYGYYRFFTWS